MGEADFERGGDTPAGEERRAASDVEKDAEDIALAK
jgi:hypothetical protein